MNYFQNQGKVNRIKKQIASIINVHIRTHTKNLKSFSSPVYFDNINPTNEKNKINSENKRKKKQTVNNIISQYLYFVH